jgi:transcriptional regulator with XRE-family HTH domain/tetratricopeptide (TPR) repeat protein
VVETFGAQIRRYRQAASLTQEALAERAGISATSIAALERGRRRAPRLSTLRLLGEALGLDADQLAELAQTASGEEHENDPGNDPVDDVRSGLPQRADSAIPSLPRVVARRWRTDFVGRNGELRMLEQARTDGVRLVLIGGGAGMGKTRLVTEFADRGTRRGDPIAWGRCSEEGLGPYAPFVEVTRHLVSTLDRTRLERAVAKRGELTRLLPELEQIIGSLPAPTRADSGTEQRLLFETVSALLAECAPLLVVIDDLHWADDATTALLSYLVCDPNLTDVMLIATVRDFDLGSKLAGRLADLDRRTDTRRLRLGVLEGDEFASLVADLVGSPVAVEIVESVAEATGGNPFFAEEMTLHLVDTGLIGEGDGRAVLRGDSFAAGVPERVREAIVSRLLSLPSDAVDLLGVGSLMGREFELPLAGRAAGLDGARLVDAADDGLLSGLVEETATGALAFPHALVQHAVGDRLSHARSAMIHRRVAEVLEERATETSAANVPVAELARHWSAVAVFDATAASVAARWAVRAGDIALAAAAADEAIARYEEASEFWSVASSGHADALIRLGTALQYRGRADEADQRFREALVLAEALADPVLQARAAVGLGRRYPYWESDSYRIDVLEQALAALGDREHLLRLSVMGLLVTQMVNGFREEEAHRRDELAEQLAAVADDPATDDETLANLGQIRMYDCIEDPVRLARAASRLTHVGEARNDLRVLSVAHFSHALSALDRASMSDLRTAADRYDVIADRMDDPRERSQAATVRSTIALIEGEYARSEELTAQALERGHESGDYNADLVFFAQGLLRAIDLGQAPDVLPLLVAATDYQRIASFTAGISLCAALAGENELALEHLERLIDSGLASNSRGADRLAPTAFLAHSCVLLGAVEHAGTLYDALRSQPAEAVRVGPLIGWWGPVDHHLGSLCRLLGRREEAEARLRRALALEDELVARPFQARTQGELARVLSEADGPEPDELRSTATAAAIAIGATGIAAEIALTP